jgi:hypothetical protein
MQQFIHFKIFIFVLTLASINNVNAQSLIKNATHELDLGIAVSFKPYKKYKIVEVNQLIDFVYNTNKSYKIPSLRVRYKFQKSISTHLKVGIETGITFRYQEKIGVANYYTFYSFPFALNANFMLVQSKSILLSFQPHVGYQFKHPKHKYLDGLGGILGGASLLIKRNKHFVSYQLGYEVQQDRNMLKIIPNPPIITEYQTIKYKQFVSQFYATVIIPLHKKIATQ